MYLYLEIINGKYAASTISLEDGDVAGVGRGAKADVFLPDDFEIYNISFLW